MSEQPQADPSAEWMEKAEGIIARYRDRRVDSLHVSIALALQSEASARASAEKALLEEQAIRHQALEDSAEFAQQRDEWARRYEAILGKHIDSGWAMAWQHVKDADARVAEITQQREEDAKEIESLSANLSAVVGDYNEAKAESSALAQKAQELTETLESVRARAHYTDPTIEDMAVAAITRALPSAPPVVHPGVLHNWPTEGGADRKCRVYGCEVRYDGSAPPAAHKLSDRYPLPWTPAAVAEANAVIAAEHPAPPATPQTLGTCDRDKVPHVFKGEEDVPYPCLAWRPIPPATQETPDEYVSAIRHPYQPTGKGESECECGRGVFDPLHDVPAPATAEPARDSAFWRDPWMHTTCGTPHGPAEPCPLVPDTPRYEKEPSQ